MGDEMAAFLWEKKNRGERSGDLSKHGIKNRPRSEGFWSRVQKAMYSWLCGDEEVDETKYFPLSPNDEWADDEENEHWDMTEEHRGKDPTKES